MIEYYENREKATVCEVFENFNVTFLQLLSLILGQVQNASEQ